MAQKGKGQIVLYTIGISQRSIASALDVDPAYVYRCLAGKQKPSKRMVKMTCKITGLQATALFDQGQLR